jgi:hypothetical protein
MSFGFPRGRSLARVRAIVPLVGGDTLTADDVSVRMSTIHCKHHERRDMSNPIDLSHPFDLGIHTEDLDLFAEEVSGGQDPERPTTATDFTVSTLLCECGLSTGFCLRPLPEDAEEIRPS